MEILDFCAQAGLMLARVIAHHTATCSTDRASTSSPWASLHSAIVADPDQSLITLSPGESGHHFGGITRSNTILACFTMRYYVYRHPRRPPMQPGVDTDCRHDCKAWCGSYCPPHRADEAPLTAFPLALPMGWVESHPYFTVLTKRVCNLANSALHRPTRHRLRVHRTEAVA